MCSGSRWRVEAARRGYLRFMRAALLVSATLACLLACERAGAPPPGDLPGTLSRTAEEGPREGGPPDAVGPEASMVQAPIESSWSADASVPRQAGSSEVPVPTLTCGRDEIVDHGCTYGDPTASGAACPARASRVQGRYSKARLASLEAGEQRRCCYAWCTRLDVASEISLSCKTPEVASVSICLAPPPAGISHPAPPPLSDCPAAIRAPFRGVLEPNESSASRSHGGDGCCYLSCSRMPTP